MSTETKVMGAVFVGSLVAGGFGPWWVPALCLPAFLMLLGKDEVEAAHYRALESAPKQGPEIEALQKQFEELQSKVNALTLRAGLGR